MGIHHLRPSLNTVINVSFPSQVINVFCSHSLPLHSLFLSHTHTNRNPPLSPSLRLSPSLLVAFLLFSAPLVGLRPRNQQASLSLSLFLIVSRPRSNPARRPGPHTMPECRYNKSSAPSKGTVMKRHPKTLLVGGHASLGSMLHALGGW